jgi:hypothetical protein
MGYDLIFTASYEKIEKRFLQRHPHVTSQNTQSSALGTNCCIRTAS